MYLIVEEENLKVKDSLRVFDRWNWLKKENKKYELICCNGNQIGEKEYCISFLYRFKEETLETGKNEKEIKQLLKNKCDRNFILDYKWRLASIKFLKSEKDETQEFLNIILFYRCVLREYY